MKLPDNMKFPDNMVYLVHDDHIVAEALVDLLSASGFNATSYRRASEYLATDRAKVPSCLVLDIELPDVDGLEFQQRLSEFEHPPVVFISGHADVASCVRAMKQGAVDYLPKPLCEENFLSAVRAALQKHRSTQQAACEMAELQGRYRSLTNRERQVLPLVISGFLNKQAAAMLDISEVTLQIHRGRVMQKMQTKSLPELVRMSAKLGIPLKGQPSFP
jgi:FixJ family two-component response regulator